MKKPIVKKPIIKINSLRKSFNKKIVLQDISLDIHKGEIFGIIGSSGSGKTTLLKLIIGFLSPDSGNVMINFRGKYISVEKSQKKVKKLMGFAAQEPSFYEKLTVFENLDYFGTLFNLSSEARLSNINTLLNLVGLSHAKNVLAKNLSGGMQRRLDIACSLIHNPEILILDEPTSDLDPILSKNIWELIKKINKKGTTIIVASHDLSEIESVCDRVGIIFEKKIENIGSIDELKNLSQKGQEIHIETYPGNYKKIIKGFKHRDLTEIRIKGNYLVIHTKKPSLVLIKLLKELPKYKEQLLDLKITMLSLSDVFTGLIKK